MNFNFKIRALQIFNYLMSMVGIIWAINAGQFWLFGVAFAAFLIFGIVGANIGMHRLFAHRSFKVSTNVEKILALVAHMTTMGSTLSWVTLHHCHHNFSDTPLDPHSPGEIGPFKAWVGMWNPIGTPVRRVSELRRSAFHRTLHRYYFSIIAIYVLILAALNPWLPVFAYCIPASLCLLGASAVTVFCHTWGYRNFETSDRSYNNWLAWGLSLGEGWHNNHHRFPRLHRQGWKWYELDVSAFIIENILDRQVVKEKSREHKFII